MQTWSQAFVRQAASDLEVYQFLDRNSFPVCHRLHYLQMWLEKLCKAYLYQRWSTEPEELRRKHQVVLKVLPKLISDHWGRIGYNRSPDIKSIRELCREIDLLHPQIDADGNRPDNVEYPWPDQTGNVNFPAGWKFALAQRLYSWDGKLLLKAAGSLTQNPAVFIRDH